MEKRREEVEMFTMILRPSLVIMETVSIRIINTVRLATKSIHSNDLELTIQPLLQGHRKIRSIKTLKAINTCFDKKKEKRYRRQFAHFRHFLFFVE